MTPEHTVRWRYRDGREFDGQPCPRRVAAALVAAHTRPDAGRDPSACRVRVRLVGDWTDDTEEET